MYTVVCDHPDGGDVIEGRAKPASTNHEDLNEALQQLARWYRRGPNGPVRTARLLRDGERINPWAEIERLGLLPLVTRDPNRVNGNLCGCIAEYTAEQLA